jgi:L-seryl-tRNA(Ser) seleniumtransferase
VGTTNRTREADFARALDDEPDVAAILRVHPGNFRQVGFVERPSLASLSALARARGVTLIEDLGGGLLDDTLGSPGEPPVAASIAGGADLVCFSTDKALGGPQGGAIVGRGALVERLRRDPLTRALRMGRLPLVALEATVTHWLRGEPDRVPAMAALRQSVAAVRERAIRWVQVLRSSGVDCAAVDLEAVAGGGAFAEEAFASAGVALEGSPDDLAAALRRGDPAVFVRIVDGRVVLDARTVLPGEDDLLLRAITAASSADKA